MSDIDWKSYSLKQLNDLQTELVQELDRRARANEAPNQIAELSARAVQAGASPEDILKAVQGSLGPIDSEPVSEDVTLPLIPPANPDEGNSNEPEEGAEAETPEEDPEPAQEQPSD